MAYVIIRQGEHMKTGDQEPDLVLQLYKENNNPEDLSSVNVVSLHMTEENYDGLIVDEDSSGTDAPVSYDEQNGKVTYEWQASDTNGPGTYVGEVEVEFSSGETKTFPSSGTFNVYVEEALN